MKKVFSVVLLSLALVLTFSCDYSFLAPKDSPAAIAVVPPSSDPSSDVSFISFACEREEAYYFKPLNINYNLITSSVSGLTVTNIPIFENDFPNSIHYGITVNGFTDRYAIQILDKDYFKQLEYNKAETYYSNSYSLPGTGSFSFIYYPRKTFTFDINFRIFYLFSDTFNIYDSTIITIDDVYYLESRNFYRYKTITIEYPGTVTIGFVIDYFPVKNVAHTKNTLSIEFIDYNEPVQGDILDLILISEDGKIHKKTISIQ